MRQDREAVEEVLFHWHQAFYGDKGSLAWLLVHPDRLVRDIGEAIARGKDVKDSTDDDSEE